MREYALEQWEAIHKVDLGAADATTPWINPIKGSERCAMDRTAHKTTLKNVVLASITLTLAAASMTKTFAELNFPGRLIAVEGLDGSGKSTQIYLLKRWLELQGLKVFFSEWNSSDLVKSATSKGKKRELLTPATLSLIEATDSPAVTKRTSGRCCELSTSFSVPATFSPHSLQTPCAAARPNGCAAFTVLRRCPTLRFSSKRTSMFRCAVFWTAGPS